MRLASATRRSVRGSPEESGAGHVGGGHCGWGLPDGNTCRHRGGRLRGVSPLGGVVCGPAVCRRHGGRCQGACVASCSCEGLLWARCSFVTLACCSCEGLLWAPCLFVTLACCSCARLLAPSTGEGEPMCADVDTTEMPHMSAAWTTTAFDRGHLATPTPRPTQR